LKEFFFFSSQIQKLFTEKFSQSNFEMFVLDIGFDRSKHNARSKRFALNVKSSISSQKNFKLCGIKEGREFTLKTLIQLVENCATKFKRKKFFQRNIPWASFWK